MYDDDRRDYHRPESRTGFIMASTAARECNYPASPDIRGTISTRLAGLIRRTAIDLGVQPSRLNAITPPLFPAVLDDDLLRVRIEWAWQVWELIDQAAGPGSGLLVAAAAEHGDLHVWDHLFTSAPTLAGSVRTVIALRGVVTDPGVDWVVAEDGRLLTIHIGSNGEPPGTVEPVEEFTLSIMLRRIRVATGRHLVPVRITFSHSDTRQYRALVNEFGTTRIDFGAPRAAITFLDAGSLPTGTDPKLGATVRNYAELLMTNYRSAPGWRENLRQTIVIALREGDPSLDGTARRLLTSPRTLQRRLREIGTSWRQEVESVRHESAVWLIRETGLPVQSAANRLGYTDARALRRAIRRWTGAGTVEFRRQPSPTAVTT